VLTSDAHIDQFDGHVAFALSLFYGRTNTRHSSINIADDSAGYTVAYAFTHTEYFDLAVFVLFTYDASDFGGTNVESDNYF
jgi:hypothetical protein